MKTREQAIKWWGMLGTKAQMQHAHGLDPKRFPAPSDIPPFKVPEGLTGREIERMWEAYGKPSVAMEFDALLPNELLGRVVKVEGSKGIDFSFIEEVVPPFFFFVFRVGDFDIKTGSYKMKDEFVTKCTLSTREEFEKFSDQMKERRRRNKCINAIIDHLQRKDGFAPTMEQIEAAAKALDLIRT